MTIAAQHVRAAQTHLKKGDPQMRAIIRQVGPFGLRPKKNHFQMLARSIISQQISVAAAKTILGRLVEHLQPHGLEAHAVAQLEPQRLRELGVSNQKANYLLDLSRRVSQGLLDLKSISRCPDGEIIEQLVTVKGIGVWTAQMFLIFSLGRLDVLPVGDLGIQKAIMQQYGLRKLPQPNKIEQLARPWRPYASVASWYLWQTLDSTPKE